MVYETVTELDDNWRPPVHEGKRLDEEVTERVRLT
jgi:hypothetical protein